MAMGRREAHRGVDVRSRAHRGAHTRGVAEDLPDQRGRHPSRHVAPSVHRYNRRGRCAVADDAERALGRRGRGAGGDGVHRHAVAFVPAGGVRWCDEVGLRPELDVGFIRGAAGAAGGDLRRHVEGRQVEEDQAELTIVLLLACALGA